VGGAVSPAPRVCPRWRLAAPIKCRKVLQHNALITGERERERERGRDIAAGFLSLPPRDAAAMAGDGSDQRALQYEQTLVSETGLDFAHGTQFLHVE